MAGRDHVWLPYAQMKTAAAPLPVVATQGSRLRLAEGRELVDGVASWWTACHGYNHPHIAISVARQLEALPHVMLGGLVHEQAARLAARLAALLPGDLGRVFFSDSGSVAVEVAMKMAVQYWINHGFRGRTKFVAFRGGYHGDTTATMAVCDPDDGMHRLFKGLLPEHVITDLPRDEETTAALDGLLAGRADEIAGILVEPLVQGAGGMLFHDAAVLQRLRVLADRHETLLIFDEVFTGFGRTGAMFACEGAGVVPDIVTLGKALSGGTLPLAATIASEKIFAAFWSDDPMHALMHGPTFMGNALGCAAANASLDLFEREPRLDQVKAIAARLADGLASCRGLPHVVDVRVRGAIGVVELDAIDIPALKARFVEEGVYVRPFGRIVYLTPAFTIGEEDLARLTGAIVRVLSET
ncbi:adenosylmethionine--8-amino-7-oxononanoate transaminase [Rhodoplanes roseus]|uniref:adenosylmethionine--8-amino-7-oxononanoate transaminase n=1 Tax=Rhodoplanes roseus TaxID=29409 RepID=UPI00247AA8F8|nr:adenosylmethionine--8-amino-7-oxononanoate transaminase [Rhodoplanes roseus]